MKKYVVNIPDKEFEVINYRGAIMTLKNGEIYDEDAQIRIIFKHLFLEKKDIVLDDINTIENDDVIIETE